MKHSEHMALYKESLPIILKFNTLFNRTRQLNTKILSIKRSTTGEHLQSL